MAIEKVIGVSANLNIGPFVDRDDARTAKTGLTIAQADVQLSKNDGAFAQKNDVNGATHDTDGWYIVPMNATDWDSLGSMVVQIATTSALPVWRELVVITSAAFDQRYVAGEVTAQSSAVLQNGMTAFGVSTITQAEVSAVTDDALANFGVSTLTSAGVSAVMNSAMSNFGVSTITAAEVSAATDDALNNLFTFTGGNVHSRMMTLATAAGANVADAVLRRNLSNVESATNVDAEAFRSLYGAASKLVNRVSVSAGVLATYKVDDVTKVGTQTITTSAAADPIIELNTV